MNILCCIFYSCFPIVPFDVVLAYNAHVYNGNACDDAEAFHQLCDDLFSSIFFRLSTRKEGWQ